MSSDVNKEIPLLCESFKFKGLSLDHLFSFIQVIWIFNEQLNELPRLAM